MVGVRQPVRAGRRERASLCCDRRGIVALLLRLLLLAEQRDQRALRAALELLQLGLDVALEVKVLLLGQHVCEVVGGCGRASWWASGHARAWTKRARERSAHARVRGRSARARTRCERPRE